MSTMIRTEHLHFSYETGGEPLPILHDVNLTIEQGEMVAIVGPSGSGKSTLLHILGCLSHVQQGRVIIDETDISRLSPRELAFFRADRLGFIFQEFHLLPRLTVLENILMPAMYPVETAHVSKADKARANELAEKLGIAHRLDHFPNQLSGGEQQRVAIARALLKNPEIVYADEPTGNLDSKTTENILALLEQLNAEGQTIVLITHDQSVAARASKRIYFKDGRIESIEQDKKVKISEIAYSPKNKSKGQAWFQFAKVGFALLSLAMKNIARHKLRSFLTMLGITIGIAAIVTMVTLGEFTKHRILAGYTKLGANTLVIYASPNWRLKATDAVSVIFQSLNMEYDVQPLKHLFPDIRMISPMLTGWQSQISYAGQSLTQNVNLVGVGRDYLRITDQELLVGRNLNPFHIDNKSAVCIVGYDIARRLFAKTSPIDQIVHLSQQDNSFACQVIGVLRYVSGAATYANPNLQIILPYTFYQANTSSEWSRSIRQLLVKVTPNVDMAKIGGGIVRYLQSKYGRSGQFQVAANTVLLAQMEKFLTLFTLMLTSIALVSLGVGGIGIMNMMLVAVSERYREIGIRKAVGATDFSMRMQYLSESLILCCIAGIVGLFLGVVGYQTAIYFASRLVAKLEFTMIFSPMAMSLASASMILVGILSGLFPALKAEKLQIVDALRSQ